MISINIFEIVMQMVNFLILLYLLKRFLLKPLVQFLDNREASIKNNLDHAEKTRQESETLIEEQKELLNQAKVEAKKIRENAEETTKREREMVLKQAQEDTQRLLENGKKELEMNFNKNKQQLLTEVGQITVGLTKQILKRDMSNEDHDTVLSEYLEQIKQ